MGWETVQIPRARWVKHLCALSNGKGRGLDTCLEISFITHADRGKEIPCWSPEKFSFARCKGTNWPCFSPRFSNQERLSPTCDSCFPARPPRHALHIPRPWDSYQILYLEWESWKSWSLPARNDRLGNESVPSKTGVGQTKQLILITNRFEALRLRCPLSIVPRPPCVCLGSVLILETVKHNMPNGLIEITLLPRGCQSVVFLREARGSYPTSVYSIVGKSLVERTETVIQAMPCLSERDASSILILLSVCLCIPSFMPFCFYSSYNRFNSLWRYQTGPYLDLEHCLFSQSYMQYFP